ncbi:MAG: serine hydrolase domain-containing protein [Acidimicrobiia bacterium]
MSRSADLAGTLVECIDDQRRSGLHLGAQVYVSRHGKPLVDAAVGESVPGRPLRDDDLMCWYSSGKPLTTAAVLGCWERGLLGLDDPVGRYVEGWGAGKERATVRHVLTHTGGFTMLGRNEPFDADLPYGEVVARIAAHPAEWEPGTAAGYHPSTGWKVLGAIVEAVDGRPIDRYLAEEVTGPAGTATSRLGIGRADQEVLGDRIVPVHWTGHALPLRTSDGGVRMVEYHIERIHNEAWHVAKVEPGGGFRGPAADLGRFYESLLGHGPPVLDPRTVELMGAVHRYGVVDAVFGTKTPWGLGVQVAGGMTGRVGRRAFGHNGMASSRGMADPDLGLVVAYVTNGLTDPIRNEQRMSAVVNLVYDALGEEAERVRRPG